MLTTFAPTIIRALLKILAGLLVGKGIIDADTVTTAMTNLESLLGILFGAVGIGWGVYDAGRSQRFSQVKG